MRLFQKRTVLAAAVFAFLSSSVIAAEAPEGMAHIPAGEFIMGNDGADLKKMGGLLSPHEMPQRKVSLKAFFIDRYEVTNKQYKEYINALKKAGVTAFSHYTDEGIPIPDRWSLEDYPEGEGNYPVVDVDWYMATKYCAFMGKRLPTEEEWEKAARGTDGRTYPWGDDHKPGYSNTLDYWTSKFKNFGEVTRNWREIAVGSFEKDVSPYGVYDMGGNAAEWTSSLYRAYPGSDLKRDSFKDEVYVIRGGAYNTWAHEFGRTTARHYRWPSDMRSATAPWHTSMTFGFRCVMDAE